MTRRRRTKKVIRPIPPPRDPKANMAWENATKWEQETRTALLNLSNRVQSLEHEQLLRGAPGLPRRLPEQPQPVVDIAATLQLIRSELKRDLLESIEERFRQRKRWWFP